MTQGITERTPQTDLKITKTAKICLKNMLKLLKSLLKGLFR